VRYLSNHSSGKMGFAIARAAADAGAITTLISGPVALATPERVERIDVVSAEQMHSAAMAQLGHCDIFIGCAAVADYRPVRMEPQKMKKSSDSMQLELVRNPDIISAVAAASQRPFTVGFAAETRDVQAYAKDKLRNKKLDMIVANDVSSPGSGFNSDENAATILWAEGSSTISLMSKQQLAIVLIKVIAEQYLGRQNQK
jgi:phosphopantothenoylcysteine decarboxylase / phosphopantothenate---cysteine ligase